MEVGLRLVLFTFLKLNKLKDLWDTEWEPVIFRDLKLGPFLHCEYSSDLT